MPSTTSGCACARGKQCFNRDKLNYTGKVLAYVFGRRKDEVFLRLQALLEPFGLTRYYTDYWGAYTRHLDPDEHCPGKREGVSELLIPC